MTGLLDLDGTLIDSAPRHSLLMAELLGQHFPEQASRFDPDEYMHYKADGHSGRQYLTDILHLEDADARMIQKAWQAGIEEAAYLDTDHLYDDAVPFLDYLQTSGCSIVYLTARQEPQRLEEELERLGIRRYAAEVIVTDPAAAGTGKLEAARGILRNDPRTFLVGDTENEHTVAETLHIPAYLLHRGFRSRRYWAAKGVESCGGLEEIRQRIALMDGIIQTGGSQT